MGGSPQRAWVGHGRLFAAVAAQHVLGFWHRRGPRGLGFLQGPERQAAAITAPAAVKAAREGLGNWPVGPLGTTPAAAFEIPGR